MKAAGNELGGKGRREGREEGSDNVDMLESVKIYCFGAIVEFPTEASRPLHKRTLAGVLVGSARERESGVGNISPKDIIAETEEEEDLPNPSAA